MHFSKSAAVAVAGLASVIPANSSYVSRLPLNSQGLFNESMAYLDHFYDSPAGYLYEESAAAALNHDTRSSVWYSIGLLARNEGEDVAQAEKIITHVIESQFKDPEDQWSVFRYAVRWWVS